MIDVINAGVGLMVYNGHSNHWNYAKLEDRSGAAVAPLMSINEAPLLVNGEKLFVGLSMTCLTSQFAVPAVTGTLDEMFVRSATGGAVATWGPAGPERGARARLSAKGLCEQAAQRAAQQPTHGRPGGGRLR
ncbi:MAG: hypothetical protein IPM07_16290 [Anaerolineales bacterium]|nr:hypothetical protein [Anaerolineales bacterium]